MLDPAIQKQLLSDYSVNVLIREILQIKMAPGEDTKAFSSNLHVCVR